MLEPSGISVMAHVFPQDLERLVQQELATCKYKSEDEVLLEAMKLLRNRETHFQQFRKDLRARLDRLDRGEGIELDDASLAAFLDEIEAEVDAETASKR
jgi:Arc/MetJ-type ribon-helix-helix transcriptional regulator